MSLDWSLISSEALNSLDLDHLIEGVEQRECFAYGEELSRLAAERGTMVTPTIGVSTLRRPGFGDDVEARPTGRALWAHVRLR